ncbi:MAG: HIRAN domain-containing protein, partial [Dehalococcoidia bacterium]|nr:HIRAN domain-containing protein [Dehalococcoidia bacterium]
MTKQARERLYTLNQGEELRLALELNNPETTIAIQVQTTDYHMMGWAPRYLVHDLSTAMSESPGEYEAKVVHVPEKSGRTGQHALIEMRGRWERHEPMSSEDYKPLVGRSE